MPDGMFHDYLKLAAADLRRVALIVFCGRSGAGKSTYLRWLTARYREQREIAVIDEIMCPRQLSDVQRAVAGGDLVLVASHLQPWRHRMSTTAIGRRRIFDLDRPVAKITAALERRSMIYSDSAIHAFCAQFGANYTDLQLLLERYPGVTFDAALALLQRECEVILEPTA